MIWLYHTVLYEPLYNLLIFLYNHVPGNDMGLAIIGLTIIIKLILLPLSWQSLKSQKALQDLQPKMAEIKKKYKDQKEKLAQETMKLYKDNKVNPLSSCFPLLIQFPFLIAVYQVFRTGLKGEHFDILYNFVQVPASIDPFFLGMIDLAVPSIGLAVLAGIGQYVQTKMLMAKKAPTAAKKGAKDENMLAEMNKSMMYFMPLITIVIGSTLPAGLTLYWLLTTVLTILQQKILFKNSTVKTNPEGVVDTVAEVIEESKDQPKLN